MAATRTQVYFTEDQRRALDALARREGKTLAEVVREAVDAYVAEAPPDVEDVLDEAFGQCRTSRFRPAASGTVATAELLVDTASWSITCAV